MIWCLCLRVFCWWWINQPLETLHAALAGFLPQVQPPTSFESSCSVKLGIFQIGKNGKNKDQIWPSQCQRVSLFSCIFDVKKEAENKGSSKLNKEILSKAHVLSTPEAAGGEDAPSIPERARLPEVSTKDEQREGEENSVPLQSVYSATDGCGLKLQTPAHSAWRTDVRNFYLK